MTALQRLCITEGIDEWKVDNYLKTGESSVPRKYDPVIYKGHLFSVYRYVIEEITNRHHN